MLLYWSKKRRNAINTKNNFRVLERMKIFNLHIIQVTSKVIIQKNSSSFYFQFHARNTLSIESLHNIKQNEIKYIFSILCEQ